MAVSATSNSKHDEAIRAVHTLIKRICRGFYTAKHCIVVDIIIKHSIMRDDHISLLMSLQNLEVRKLCGKLREDRILTMHNKLEVKPGQTRPINRTYYYIVYRDAVDAIKYKMHKLVRTIEEQSKNKRYSALDVLPFVTSDGQSFQCGDCSSILVDDQDSLENKASQERLGRLRRQTESIISTLKDIDNVEVPQNDFVTSSAQAIPPSLEMLYTPAYPHGLPGSGLATSTGPGGRQDTSTLGVSIDFDGGAAASEEARRRKAQQSEMNQLPEWHLKSTVSGDWIDPAGAAARSGSAQKMDRDSKEAADELDAAAADDVAQYYKMLKEQQAREAAASDDDAGSELMDSASKLGVDEDEDGDFEGAMPGIDASASVSKATTVTNTPAPDVAEDDSEDSGEFEDVV